VHGNIIVTAAGQAGTSLSDLAARIREAHAGVTAAVSSVVKHALAAGRAAIAAQGMVTKGQWEHWLQKSCDVTPRHVRRYMALARAYEASGHSVSEDDLVGLSLRGAIKKLTPPQPKAVAAVAVARKKGPDPKTSRSRVRHVDILALWIEAPLDEQVKTVDGIGLQRLLGIIPVAWWPLIEKHVAERRQSSTSTEMVPADSITDDLSIPRCLRRTLPEKNEATA
jgi:hypothetical protein